MTKRLNSNPKSLIPFMALDGASPTSVSSMLEHVPVYGPTEWRRLVENTIGAIHQIPHVLKSRSLPDIDLKDIEAYFGRSSAGANVSGLNLHRRFQAGVVRGHLFGMVFAQTSISATLKFERFGISLIKQLNDLDGLCISNRTVASHGNVGVTEPGYLYMTFTLRKGSEHARVLTQKQIDAAVAGVLADLRQSTEVGSVKSIHEDAARTAVTLANDVTYHGQHEIILAR